MTHELMNEGLENPVVFFQYYQETKAEDLQIKAAADMGALILTDSVTESSCTTKAP